MEFALEDVPVVAATHLRVVERAPERAGGIVVDQCHRDLPDPQPVRGRLDPELHRLRIPVLVEAEVPER